MDLDMLYKRAAIIKRVRSFFDNKNYLELDTPLLCGDLIPESCLEVFQTERLFPRGSKKESRPLWLIPSPEIWMKKIIAKHNVNVYQICKCFRNGESCGHLHNSEFTMLEYYTINADYMDSLTLTEELFSFLTEDSFCSNGNTEANNGASEKKLRNIKSFERITVADAFAKWAGFDLFATAEEGQAAMDLQARKLGLDPMPGLTTPQLYDLIFIHAVEPQLKSQKPVALIDYPTFVPCLAKKSPNGRTVERWELYCNGIELANCYSEETNPQAVKDFFISEEAEKNRTAVVKHKVDHDYWKIFKTFPNCSGVAIGLDRLIMSLTGKTTIDGVIDFIVS
ncbi:LysR family transcriptional regulator [Treponema sp. R8-4-B8]